MKIEIDTTTRRQVAEAIRLMQARIKWKPGKDIRHLRTRKDYGHLEPTVTLKEYEAIIHGALTDSSASVYAYVWETDIYPTVVSVYEEERWLVMFSLNGVMETSFPPADPNEYLSDVRFHYLDSMENLFNE